jgi:hypothetical protein
MTVIKNERGTWDVIDEEGYDIRCGFASEDAAWRWIDTHS